MEFSLTGAGGGPQCLLPLTDQWCLSTAPSQPPFPLLLCRPHLEPRPVLIGERLAAGARDDGLEEARWGARTGFRVWRRE